MGLGVALEPGTLRVKTQDWATKLTKNFASMDKLLSFTRCRENYVQGIGMVPLVQFSTNCKIGCLVCTINIIFRAYKTV